MREREGGIRRIVQKEEIKKRIKKVMNGERERVYQEKLSVSVSL